MKVKAAEAEWAVAGVQVEAPVAAMVAAQVVAQAANTEAAVDELAACTETETEAAPRAVEAMGGLTDKAVAGVEEEVLWVGGMAPAAWEGTAAGTVEAERAEVAAREVAQTEAVQVGMAASRVDARERGLAVAGMAQGG